MMTNIRHPPCLSTVHTSMTPRLGMGCSSSISTSSTWLIATSSALVWLYTRDRPCPLAEGVLVLPGGGCGILSWRKNFSDVDLSIVAYRRDVRSQRRIHFALGDGPERLIRMNAGDGGRL